MKIFSTIFAGFAATSGALEENVSPYSGAPHVASYQGIIKMENIRVF